MKAFIPGFVFFLIVSPVTAERMPWETDEYFENQRKAREEHLSKFPLEMMLFIGAPSSPDAAPYAWVRLGDEIEFPLDPRVKISSTFEVPLGMKIGLNNGVVKDINPHFVAIEERIPVCGESGFTTRTTLLRINQPLPEGTTVDYEVIDGRNACK